MTTEERLMHDILGALNELILRTPTSEKRNELTAAHIHLMTAEKLPAIDRRRPSRRKVLELNFFNPKP